RLLRARVEFFDRPWIVRPGKPSARPLPRLGVGVSGLFLLEWKLDEIVEGLAESYEQVSLAGVKFAGCFEAIEEFYESCDRAPFQAQRALRREHVDERQGGIRFDALTEWCDCGR